MRVYRAVPTIKCCARKGGHARFAHPYASRHYFFTSGHSLASSGLAASSGAMVAISL
jgi:hypothetical protein